MSFARDLNDRLARENAEDLARAEREALAAGKEPFDLAKFERLYQRGSQASNEEHWRGSYYIFNRELKTLAEFVAFLHRIEPWEDCR